jgi:hypothetical protein
VSDHDRLVGAFREIFNLTEEQAECAVRGRDVRPVESGYDGVVDMFRDVFGLSEQGARAAAQGRESLSEARRFWGSSGSSSSERRGSPLQEAAATLAAMTDAECDAMLEEQRKRRTPAKKAAPAKQPSSRSKITTVSETTYPRGRR